MKTITARIPRRGMSAGDSKVEVETSGFTGSACQDASERFIQALGEPRTEELKPEFYATGENHEHLSQG